VLLYDDDNKGIYLTTSDGVVAIGQSIKGDNFDTFTLQPVKHLNVNNYTYYGISTAVVDNDASSILVVGTADNTMMELKVTQMVFARVGGYTHLLYLFICNQQIRNCVHVHKSRFEWKQNYNR